MKEHAEERYFIKSVEKFLNINNSWLHRDLHPGKWMFRGHDNYDYSLIPSVGRLLGKGIFKKTEILLDYEKSAFNEFQISSYSQLNERNPFILLAVAQHHGLKTRLLDWSFSPLVALFFAVENENNYEKDGALICFQSRFTFNDFPESCKTPFDATLNDYHFVFCPDLSPRMSAQSGIFQLFKHPTVEFSEGYNLMKFKIPAASKESIKTDLETLGIAYRTLFPGLDGLCNTINYNKLRA